MAAAAPVIGDLLKINQHLVIACFRSACGREERLSAVQAVKLLGFHTTFSDASRRLVCRRCGARGRRREVEVRPCSLDQAAWDARQRHISAARHGERIAGDLDEYLDTLCRLAGGALGGDGPVGWVPDDAPH